MPLEWVEAERDHITKLRGFVCTDPSKRIYSRETRRQEHPRPWELDVQSAVRTKLRPPRRAPEYLYLGMDGDEIAAVAHFSVDTSEPAVMIHIVARAISFRGRGVGKETAERVLSLTAELATGIPVYTRIHYRNESSSRLFAQLGFRPITEPNESGMRLWMRD